MSILSSLSERFGRGETVLSAWCGLSGTSNAAALAREAFDAVTIDMQHGPISLDDAIKSIPLINAAGKPALARVPVGEFQNVSRLLDAGASGVIAPMVNTMADAHAFAAYAKYPPMGERSWGSYAGLGNSGLDQNTYLAKANSFSMAFAMIETREAMAICGDILALPGIDGVFIGPSDLSIALSGGTSVDPMSKAVDEAVSEVVRQATKAGKPVALYAHTAERARDFLKLGAKMICIQSDLGFLKAGAQMALDIIRR